VRKLKAGSQFAVKSKADDIFKRDTYRSVQETL
jgi:hypothetical protein